MAGHNRWSQIRHKKAAEDRKRSQIFTRLIREIMVAVREGGPDPEFNPRLRAAISNARAHNMPKENIERAIKKAMGGEAGQLQESVYEGYAPHGVAVIVECLSDNLNRTVSNLRYLFSKHGGRLATSGSVSYLFSHMGVINVDVGSMDGVQVEELALEAVDRGAEDVQVDGALMGIYVRRESFAEMVEWAEKKGLKVVEASLQYVPMSTVRLGKKEAMEVLRLLDALEDDPDVRAVHHNLELTEELEAELSA